MLIKIATNEKPLNLSSAVLISIFFGLIVLQYDFKAVALLGLFAFLFVYCAKTEYAFYFLLASRSIIDIYVGFEAVGAITPTQIIGIFIASLFLLYFIFSGYHIFHLGINKVFGIFLFLSISSIFSTQNLISGFGSWLKLLQGFLFLNMSILLILSVKDGLYKKRMNTICWSIIVAVLLPYALFLKNYLQGSHTEIGGYARYSADFGSYPNLFSYYLLPVFPICLFFYSISVERSKKIFWILFMVMLLFAIYKSYTRNVWMAIAVMLLTWNVVRKNFKVIILFVSIAALMVFFSSEVQDRFKDIALILQSRSFFDLEPTLLSSRIGIWQSNLNYFFHKTSFMEKLFGSGFDVKYSVLSLSSDLSHSIEEHNNYLSLLMNTGICGLFVYCLYIVMLFRESLKLLRKTNDIYLKNLAQISISFVVTYAVVCFFTHMMWKINFQYYFSSFLGIVVAANFLSEKKGIEMFASKKIC
ncbi:MAG: O-antigen ligase family protein [Candidatus Brocadiaceae bacterium]|nr:O-antigen ligase family protein [Candidatus Brocadiaceae bacterium]